jgi:excisionase family DNA binding protein
MKKPVYSSKLYKKTPNAPKKYKHISKEQEVIIMVALQYTETKYLLKVSEAANMLGLSVHTVYRLIEQGELQCKRLSVRKTLIPAAEIERYVSEH